MARLVQDGSWQATRERQLTAEPLCRMCREVGRLIPATVCDHIERHGGEPARFWCGPFQSLCASCHSSEKQGEERQRQAPSAIIPHYFNDTNVFGVSQGSTEFKDCNFRSDVVKTAYIRSGKFKLCDCEQPVAGARCRRHHAHRLRGRVDRWAAGHVREEDVCNMGRTVIQRGRRPDDCLHCQSLPSADLKAGGLCVGFTTKSPTRWPGFDWIKSGA